MDLFETPELIPVEIQKILDTRDEYVDQYRELDRILEEIELLGYTFEYYLDADPYNLQKI